MPYDQPPGACFCHCPTQHAPLLFQLQRRFGPHRQLTWAQLQAAPEALLLLDDQGCVLAANPAACQLLDCAETALVQRSLLTLFQSPEAQTQARLLAPGTAASYIGRLYYRTATGQHQELIACLLPQGLANHSLLVVLDPESLSLSEAWTLETLPLPSTGETVSGAIASPKTTAGDRPLLHAQPRQGQSMVAGSAQPPALPAATTLPSPEQLLQPLLAQALHQVYLMQLEAPVPWDESVNKRAVLEYVFAHEHRIQVNPPPSDPDCDTDIQPLGITPAQLFARDLQMGKQLWRTLMDRGQLQVVTQETRQDGSLAWIEGHYTCLYDEQGGDGACGHSPRCDRTPANSVGSTAV